MSTESPSRVAPWSWKPGQSGNPGGRPKESREFKRLCREKAVWCFHKLVELAEGSDQSFSLRALELLLAYGIGKPVQQLEIESTHKAYVIAIPTNSTETLELNADQWLTEHKQTIELQPTQAPNPIPTPSPNQEDAATAKIGPLKAK